MQLDELVREWRTDGGRLDHVSDGESLDCLVLGCAATAVGAANGLYMATTVLVTSTVWFISDSCGYLWYIKLTWTLAS